MLAFKALAELILAVRFHDPLLREQLAEYYAVVVHKNITIVIAAPCNSPIKAK